MNVHFTPGELLNNCAATLKCSSFVSCGVRTRIIQVRFVFYIFYFGNSGDLGWSCFVVVYSLANIELHASHAIRGERNSWGWLAPLIIDAVFFGFMWLKNLTWLGFSSYRF